MRILSLFFVLLMLPPAAQAGQIGDIVDEVSLCFKNGDTKELSKYFSSSMSIVLRKDEGVYSKVQSEIILKEFFNRNAPEEVKLVHRLNSSPNFRYVVMNLTTANGAYRVSYKLVSEANTFKMTELRIE